MHKAKHQSLKYKEPANYTKFKQTVSYCEGSGIWNALNMKSNTDDPLYSKNLPTILSMLVHRSAGFERAEQY